MSSTEEKAVRWINHKVSTFAIVFALTHDPVVSAISAVGSIIPDALEGSDYQSQNWKRRHRKITHWLLGYALVAASLWFALHGSVHRSVLTMDVFTVFKVLNSATILFVMGFVLFWFSVGCILHVLEDSLSGPVPLMHPTRRVFSVGIFRTGSVFEYILSFGLLFTVLGVFKK